MEQRVRDDLLRRDAVAPGDFEHQLENFPLFVQPRAQPAQQFGDGRRLIGVEHSQLAGRGEGDRLLGDPGLHVRGQPDEALQAFAENGGRGQAERGGVCGRGGIAWMAAVEQDQRARCFEQGQRALERIFADRAAGARVVRRFGG